MVVRESSRRELFARFRGGPEQIRPPWSIAEEAFLQACTQCGKCIRACPTGLIGGGHGGYPIADFARGVCTFCGACASACEAECFDARGSKPAWAVKAVISAACVEPKGVTCRRCEDACETAAISFRPKLGGGSTPQIDGARCTGCGACVAPCPLKAIGMTRMAAHEVTT